jgi:hypothetical protein
MLGFSACAVALALATIVLESAIIEHRVIGSVRESLSGLAVYVALYIAVAVAACAVYYGVLRLSSRGLATRGAQVLAIGVPVALSVLLAFRAPQISPDVYTYIVHGHQLGTGINPYVQPAKEAASTPIGAELAQYGWIAVHGVSPYGALWTWIEHQIGRATPDIPRQVLLYKAIAVSSMLGCAWLIWLILARVDPERRMFGTLVFLWNPVVMSEIAVEGHNDSLMLLFLLLSIWFCLQRTAAPSVIAAIIGGLVKVVPLIFLLPQAVFLWHSERNRWRLLGMALIGLCVGAMIAIVFYRPVWVGSETFDGLRAHGRPSVLQSTPGALLFYLQNSIRYDIAVRLLSLMCGAAFGAYVLLAALRIHDERSLLRACGGIAVVYLVLAPGYWPWYVVMPVALLALVPDRGAVAVVMAFTFCARLAAPIDTIRRNGFYSWTDEVVITTIIGLWLPATVYLVVFGREIAAAAALDIQQAWQFVGRTWTAHKIERAA